MNIKKLHQKECMDWIKKAIEQWKKRIWIRYRYWNLKDLQDLYNNAIVQKKTIRYELALDYYLKKNNESK